MSPISHTTWFAIHTKILQCATITPLFILYNSLLPQRSSLGASSISIAVLSNSR